MTRQDGPADGHPGRELDDDILAEEIRLLGELVLAASGVSRHLTQDEVDQLLGLCSTAGGGP